MTIRADVGCNFEQLRDQLSVALVEADRCDPMVAIHVETALALLNERFGPVAQTSSR